MKTPATSIDELTGLRARAWVRESTKRQFDRHGPESQRKNMRTFTDRFGLRLDTVEYVTAGSGKTVHRSPQMQRMIGDARLGMFDILIVGYYDRFQRNLRRTLEIVEDELHPNGVAWVMADLRLVSGNPADWDQMIELALEAERYSTKLGGRIRDGKAAKRETLSDEGSGLVPVGFQRAGDNKVIEPDPRTMPVALQAWELAAAGRADQAIADVTGLTLWQVRTIMRSGLYLGRLRDGRPTSFPAPVPADTAERALAHRSTRKRIGNRARTYRVYPLSGSGPAVCDGCRQPVKGDTKSRRDGTKARVYRHRPDGGCGAWHVGEVSAAVIEDQVGQLLRGAAPDDSTKNRLRSVLAAPVVTPDNLGVRRLEARLKALGAEMVATDRTRSRAVITAEIEQVERELEEARLATITKQPPSPIESIAWLNDLGTLWDDTDDEGRRALAVALFDELGITSGERRGSHRITSVKVSEDAEARGLLLALPSRLEVTLVGDTGFEPVTSRM